MTNLTGWSKALCWEEWDLWVLWMQGRINTLCEQQIHHYKPYNAWFWYLNIKNVWTYLFHPRIVFSCWLRWVATFFIESSSELHTASHLNRNMCDKRGHEKKGEDGLPVTASWQIIVGLYHDLSGITPPLSHSLVQNQKEKKKKQNTVHCMQHELSFRTITSSLHFQAICPI